MKVHISENFILKNGFQWVVNLTKEIHACEQ